MPKNVHARKPTPRFFTRRLLWFEAYRLKLFPGKIHFFALGQEGRESVTKVNKSLYIFHGVTQPRLGEGACRPIHG
jgi:hypothetical protein